MSATEERVHRDTGSGGPEHMATVIGAQHVVETPEEREARWAHDRLRTHMHKHLGCRTPGVVCEERKRLKKALEDARMAVRRSWEAMS